MAAHSLRADHQLRSNLGLLQPLCEQVQDLELPRGKKATSAPAAVGVDPRDQAAHANEELVGGERLRHVVVGAEEQPGDAVVRLRAVPERNTTIV